MHARFPGGQAATDDPFRKESAPQSNPSDAGISDYDDPPEHAPARDSSREAPSLMSLTTKDDSKWYAALLAILLVVLAFAWFVWPTPYHYETATETTVLGRRSIPTTTVIRINRMSGEVCFWIVRPSTESWNCPSESDGNN